MAEEEREERRRLPTKEDILEKAIELYMEEHPEAAEHRLTPEVHELKEGGYLERARNELMRDISREIEELTSFLIGTRQEVEKAVERLKELGETPPWPPPSPEELLEAQSRLESRIAVLEAQVAKATREKRMLEEQIAALQKAYEEAKAELAKREKPPIYKLARIRITQYVPSFIGLDGKAYGPFYPGDIVVVLEEDAQKLIRQGLAQPYAKPEADKEALKKEAYSLWEIYINAVVVGDIKTASETAKRLREIRPKLQAAK